MFSAQVFKTMFGIASGPGALLGFLYLLIKVLISLNTFSLMGYLLSTTRIVTSETSEW